MAVIVSQNIYPGARVVRTSDLSVANNTTTYVDLQNATVDPWGMWSAITNPSRLTCQVPGLYYVTAHAQFNTGGVGVRSVGLIVNRTTYYASASAATAGTGIYTQLSASDLIPLNLNDYVEMLVFQTQGAALNLVAGSGFSASRIPS